ncbi:MAG: hypothetical protein U0V70_13700 [Terriglobia bacterium]
MFASLNHQEPDRVPMDLGSARFTGMVKPAYEKLCRHLGFGKTGAMLDRMQQLVEMDEQVLQALDVDARAFGQNPPDHDREKDLDEERWMDEWGVVRRKPPGCQFYEMEKSPLSGSITPRTSLATPSPIRRIPAVFED